MVKIRDYHKKKYGNPFFKKVGGGSSPRGRGFYFGGKRKRGGKLLRNLLVALFILIAGGGWIYFLFYSPYFMIKNIEISGLERISRENMMEIINSQISEPRFLFFDQRSIFLFDEKDLEKKINAKYALESLSTEKKIPDIVRIDISEKNPALFWKTEEKFYSLGSDGAVIQELTAEEFSSLWKEQSGHILALVEDESNQAVFLNKNSINKELVEFVVQLNDFMANKISFEVHNFKVNNKNDIFVRAITPEGWEIYFSKINDLNAQIDKLRSFLTEKRAEDRKGLQYVDLRFEDRIYYK